MREYPKAAELERVSLQQTPNQVLAIFEIPDNYRVIELPKEDIIP